MVTAYQRGYKVIFLDGKWVYEDDHSPANIERPCKRCGKLPTKEGYDACLGHVEGASSVCCGHGIEEPIFIKEELNEPFKY